jgi:2-polyprenyl-3-methyl-5-hydroxy-6-metoxy-1,4-benzoquinol methylase
MRILLFEIERDAVAFHSAIAEEFHASYDIDANRLERIELWRRYLDKYAKQPAFAYDLGCGSGELTCELASRAGKVVAIDGSDVMLAIAAETAKSRGLKNLLFRKERLPIENTVGLQTAQLVISSSVIEYLTSVDAAFEFVRKLLSPGGVVIFSVANKDCITRKIARFIQRITGYPRYLGFVRHFFDEKEIHSVLKRTNMRYVEHTYFDGKDRLNRALSLVVSDRKTCNLILVVAQRIDDD